MAIYRPPLEDGGRCSGSGESAPTTASSPAMPDSGRENRLGLADSSNSFSSFRIVPERRRSSIHEFVQDMNGNPHMRQLNKLRILCGDVVNHPNVQILIIVLIVVNAIMMGIATFDFVTDNPAVDNAFEKTDMVFLIIFTIELVMQFIYRGYTLFLDGWLVFDFLIVVLSWSFASLQIIRAFRIFRALRIITRIETMRNLVTALFDIMPRLGAITALLILIFYIFAVLFTQLFGELELSGNYFDTLYNSLLTLFVMMTMEWADVARECMAKVWWAWAPFVAFIMITGFIVFNLIIAVVCDAVAVIENKEDLQPGFFEGVLASKEELEGGEALARNEIVNGAGGGLSSPNGTALNGLGSPLHEQEMVENLAERMTSVLNSQKEMLALLETLTKDSLSPISMPQAGEKRWSCEEEEDKMPEG